MVADLAELADLVLDLVVGGVEPLVLDFAAFLRGRLVQQLAHERLAGGVLQLADVQPHQAGRRAAAGLHGAVLAEHEDVVLAADELTVAVVEGGQRLFRALGLEGQHGLVEQGAGLAGVAALHRAKGALRGLLLGMQQRRGAQGGGKGKDEQRLAVHERLPSGWRATKQPPLKPMLGSRGAIDIGREKQKGRAKGGEIPRHGLSHPGCRLKRTARSPAERPVT